ncbi:hypothetical protein GCM10007036_23640 [Alsobacter metallidurans]|uniref:Uncharacterized protein n=1 Tax=Alsobacter metallidurans TaxID=340221 RepID=A0A917I7F4_9HYPH|nr:hypothetical protein [Alsobacter metallidurans]GGH20214.1 hypothetical protein GCM10007036_23640 [Alsobacter metallidurans]
MSNKTYVVRLVDCMQGPGGLNDDAGPVLASLKVWYAAVCQDASAKGEAWTADVAWMNNPASSNASQNPGDGLVFNLMLFFIPSPRESVIKLNVNMKGVPLPMDDRTVWGLTSSSEKNSKTLVAISEIYVARCRAGGGDAVLNIARMGFHEGMHNQLGLGDGMHRSARGFKAETPEGNSPLAENIKDMASRISTLVPQWPEGLQAWRNNQNDPLGI